MILATGLGSFAGNIQASLSYCTFKSPVDGPYVETYLSIYSPGLVFKKNSNGKFQANVGITMIFKQGQNIMDFKKYELKSPEIDDTTKVDFSFLDQQRFLLPEGDYLLDFQIADLNNGKPPVGSIDNFKLQFEKDKVQFSGIQLIESWKKSEQPGILTKSGYDLVPYVFNFFPPSISKFTFYTEIYDTDTQFGADGKYLLQWYIKSAETDKTLPEFNRIKKEIAKPVNVLLQEFDIARLPSGNYVFVAEVRNDKNELIAMNNLYFQRSNPSVQFDIADIQAMQVENSFVALYTSPDSLRYFIRSLDPISMDIERVYTENQLNNMTTLMMQQYLLNFWQKRDNLNPEKAWLAYKSEVNRVDEAYKTPIKRGFETDRGRIWLKYGPPNTITDQPFEASNSGLSMGHGQRDGDMGTVPYQIWHYYQLKNNLRDKKFVFANPSLATNDYALIHSNVPGEINNPNWQSELYRQIGIYDKDELAPNGRYGSKSGELYNMPR